MVELHGRKVELLSSLPLSTENGAEAMSLNIKNPETHKLVKELATLKGVSLTTAVTLAVVNEIEREKSAGIETQRPKKRSEILAEYADQIAPLFKGGRTGNELINDLYDNETGLPK
jgi:hypothetical protein